MLIKSPSSAQLFIGNCYFQVVELVLLPNGAYNHPGIYLVLFLVMTYLRYIGELYFPNFGAGEPVGSYLRLSKRKEFSDDNGI